MNVIVLALSAETGRQWQYQVEDLGAEWCCVPVSSAELAMQLLDDAADILLLLPCRESRLLLDALLAGPPLTPPFVLGANAPDGPLSVPSALPGLVENWRRKGQLPALAQRHLPAARVLAAALLRTLGVPHRLRAWAFLPEMCALTVVHPAMLQDLQHGLYLLIARQQGLTAAGVERSLRLCVESTWSHGSLEALERFFGSSVDPEKGKPTNREFLCRMQERLTLGMRRLL